ncbi:hypothetical protein CKO28_18820 [Rhodovibrio sodomensis]|uniref:Uncharacterized protein n=1 Tax=Rhodovibrio sodomensis TaxID=1088 RepID=A0ABS1DHY9_9PROT|nr:hypothetical protein [Rhodovibrio sodomensis]MBK1670092.1 hypothetical protein [Rhodovibrio sodomensis]
MFQNVCRFACVVALGSAFATCLVVALVAAQRAGAIDVATYLEDGVAAVVLATLAVTRFGCRASEAR